MLQRKTSFKWECFGYFEFAYKDNGVGSHDVLCEEAGIVAFCITNAVLFTLRNFNDTSEIHQK